MCQIGRRFEGPSNQTFVRGVKYWTVHETEHLHISVLLAQLVRYGALNGSRTALEAKA